MDRTLVLLLLFIVSLSILSLGLQSGELTWILENATSKATKTKSPAHVALTANQTQNLTNRVIMYIPAVDSQGNGVMAKLEVEVRPGHGRALANINQILFWVDTQHSIRTALRVAENYTHINLTNYDVIYSIYTNASIIEGPSAGAALTIATIAALTNKTLNPNVTITGTINHDGSIGPVGQVFSKGKAAKDFGMNTFLVPLGQSKQITYREIKHCDKYGFMTFCTTEIKPEKVDIAKELGIKVVEVQNIREALKYFFTNN